MRINASDVQFIFRSEYKDATEWQRAQSSSLAHTELDDDNRPLRTAVNVNVNLQDAYTTDTYSRLSSSSLVKNSSPEGDDTQTQTHVEYEAVIQAAAEGLIEQQINVGMILAADSSEVEENIARPPVMLLTARREFSSRKISRAASF